ncbi:hypothetical protein HS041_22520 [Planomonospora sp. ID67723]|uniref:hypothetical protein n=1 Tax=Planomonospora sp. ID67723 TaxID=2738134 RepID=UPI0018C3AABB|nr:hypothetical protein [Planomonospora sp. ID67723]MBG0830540.1 hypothetical protein [Planomonospora sp. ID67723]
MGVDNTAWAMREARPSVGQDMFDRSEQHLAMPLSYAEQEAVEQATATRVVVRIALARHGCTSLDCPVHEGVCECPPPACADPGHAADAAAAREVLEVLGIVELQAGTRTCSKCRREKALEQFALNNKRTGGRESACRMCRAADQFRRRQAAKEAS